MAIKPYYQADGVEIFHGDCAEILPQLGRHDLLLTDPPYGIGETAGKNKSRAKLALVRDYGNLSWDDEPPSDLLIATARNACRHQIIFGGNYFVLLAYLG